MPQRRQHFLSALNVALWSLVVFWATMALIGTFFGRSLIVRSTAGLCFVAVTLLTVRDVKIRLSRRRRYRELRASRVGL
jgi:predicted branched-subunit amino acid permease